MPESSGNQAAGHDRPAETGHSRSGANTGSVLLDGPCRLGFVTGNTWMNGSGTLYKAGRAVGTVSLSGAIFINQYVTGAFVWVAQDVFLSGRYDETDDSAR